MAFLVGAGIKSLFFGRFFKIISDLVMEESYDYKSLKKLNLVIVALKKAL